MVLAYTKLANDLKNLRAALNESGSAFLMLNDWVQLRFSLEDKTAEPLAPIRPYQTIMLTKDPSEIEASLPRDCPPNFRKFIQKATITKSFLELEEITEIPLTYLLKFAAHLVYWRHGRIVDTLTRHNFYVVSESAAIDMSSSVSHEFAMKFKSSSRTLQENASRFSVQKRLSQHVQRLDAQATKEVIDELVWMLQHGLVVQLHIYIYFLPPGPESLYDELDTDVGHLMETLTEQESEQQLEVIQQRNERTFFERLGKDQSGQAATLKR